MRVDVITIFPDLFRDFLGISMIKRALDRQIVSVNLVDLRDFTQDAHRTVDDRPYGGGPGMVMKPEPIFDAVDAVRTVTSHVILLTPQGEVYRQAVAAEMAQQTHLIIICGHYEGVDERVRIGLADRELSIGDYVLTNGNVPAMIVMDSVIRLLPGVLGCNHSVTEESFAEGSLEYPQYTRPAEYRGLAIPDILLSGDHERIRVWRQEQSLLRTRQRRPDLLPKLPDGQQP